jgi:hypothetical protein
MITLTDAVAWSGFTLGVLNITKTAIELIQKASSSRRERGLDLKVAKLLDDMRATPEATWWFTPRDEDPATQEAVEAAFRRRIVFRWRQGEEVWYRFPHKDDIFID